MMKRLFYFLIVALMTLCSTTASAQQLRFGVEASVNGNAVTNSPIKGNHELGFSLGGRVEYYPNTVGLYFVSGLNFTKKGYVKAFLLTRWDSDRKEVSGIEGTPIVGHRYLGTANPIYLELPLRVGYRLKLSDKVALRAEFGPWIGVGLFGRSVYYVYPAADKNPETVHASCFNSEDYRRFEVGIGGRLGVEFRNHWQIMAGYDYQLNNIMRKHVNRNETYGISAIYMF